MTRPPSDLDVLHAEHHALSVAMHARPPANAVRVCQCRPDDLRPADGDSPEAEAAAIRAARRGFTRPADTD